MFGDYVLHDNDRPAGCLCLECQWRWEVQGIEALMMRGMTCPWWDLHEKPTPVSATNAVCQTVVSGGR